MIDVNYLGHSCFKISNRKFSLLIDPFNEKAVDLKLPRIDADAVLCTHSHLDHHDLSKVNNYRLLIDGPGEYEIGGIKISGLLTYHDNKNGKEKGYNTIYEIKIDGVTFVHLGDLGHKLTNENIETLDGVDILMIPVGGVHTIDSNMASEVIDQLEPLIILPMHYGITGNKKGLDSLETFLTKMNQTTVIKLPKLAIVKDKLPEKRQIVVLN